MPRKTIRRRYTPAEKARWALEVLKEEKTLAQLASESGVHVNPLRQWRDTLTAHAAEVFSNDQPALQELQAAHEREKTELFATIGQLTTEVNWLKKKSTGLRPGGAPRHD